MNPKQLLLLFFSLFLTITFSLNERFEACDAKTCGNGQNISYPFYIQGKQKPFCGQPGFELTCSHKGFPILTLMYTPYTIHQIFYDNQSLRVSNPVFSQPNLSSCIAPTQNLTVGRYRFRVAPNQRELFVLYGCDSAALQKTVPERRIWCSAAGNETTSVVGLDKGDRDLVSARESCKGGAVNATVDDLKGGVREALQRGFLLLWNATSCSECKSSGGRCGFDIDPRVYAFRCYCPDRPHAVKCTNTGTKGLSKAGKLVIGLSVVILCMLMIGLLLHCKRKHSSSSGQFQTRNTFSIPSSPNAEVESGSVYFGVPLFSYKELAEATNRFDLNKQIGDGGFGTVYNVADFGLSRLFPNDMTHVSTAPQGTPGYVDPEYHQCYQLTSKSDVYSFGVVLIELISSMPAVDMNRHKDEINLSNLAIKKIQERALSELVDPYLGFDSDKEVKRMIVEVAELAFQCLQQDRELRPPMDEVLEVLKRIESGKDELKHLEEAVHGSGSGVSHNVTTSSLDEAGLLKNRKPPSSPISVTDSWESSTNGSSSDKHSPDGGGTTSRPLSFKDMCLKKKRNRSMSKIRYAETKIDVVPCGACRPWIFFINEFLCFLRSDCSRMEKEKDEWRRYFK
ncbi:LEAF RUST 10 DISEASE-RESISTANCEUS RECEPTOR-LIKE PROTEIN KINASE-like 1.2 isoform X2 [Glycine max]|uniref:LEAF RUST 10 DISEASE-RESISTANCEUS RECEPTOR-LIKE PROTEIN KINASE-like 1.2 isoform X2 n=1 Tax=Glycine max TaxID=3847 RepID=UPI001B3574B7|nr:LEAF RUST 10 DISEASE-RESISTANCE LOCUS RECEPTOR-LIKE PROTEIN KINASE-like 1.2 isoform X2 [Glycine max]